MRRWLVAVVSVAALAALSGCESLPKGVDGDLANGWKAFPKATQWRPDANTCHDQLEDQATQSSDTDEPCDTAHGVESVAVADLPPSVTDEDSASSVAFKSCVPLVNAFLGGDYRNGWVAIHPVLPSEVAWNGGARWYRCDVAELSKADLYSTIDHSGSMKGALKNPAGSLVQGCYNAVNSKNMLVGLKPLNCAVSHDTEYAGYFTSSADTVTDSILQTCKGVISRYAKIPNDGNFHYRTGWIPLTTDDTEWELGDHTVRCYIWQDLDKVKGSYKGAGTTKMHIHYD